MMKENTLQDLSGEIMVIDDTPESLSLMTQILEEAGYKVRSTKNPEFAIDAPSRRFCPYIYSVYLSDDRSIFNRLRTTPIEF